MSYCDWQLPLNWSGNGVVCGKNMLVRTHGARGRFTVSHWAPPCGPHPFPYQISVNFGSSTHFGNCERATNLTGGRYRGLGVLPSSRAAGAPAPAPHLKMSPDFSRPSHGPVLTSGFTLLPHAFPWLVPGDCSPSPLSPPKSETPFSSQPC